MILCYYLDVLSVKTLTRLPALARTVLMSIFPLSLQLRLPDLNDDLFFVVINALKGSAIFRSRSWERNHLNWPSQTAEFSQAQNET